MTKEELQKVHKVFKNGDVVEMTYSDICHDLGFLPECHFVSIHQKCISFTFGKPEEIHALLYACREKGYTPTKKMADMPRRHII